MLNAEQWKEIERLYHASIELEPARRAQFLANACPHDEIRRKVELLLAHRDDPASFINRPGLEVAAEMITHNESDSLVGRTIDQYQVLDLIGAGGMGLVYRARDTKLGRDVALKILPAEFSQDKERLIRSEREARLLASLNHPNIAAIYDLKESDGIRCLVLEYIEGETLAARLKRGPLPINEALNIGRHVAGALEAAHEQGIVHRDVKSGNVMITTKGGVKVLDFGIAKILEASSGAETRDTLTAGVLLGTPAYMSPEQVRGGTVDKRTDIWAFGCLLYEALIGRPVFAGETVSDTIATILGGEPNWQMLPRNTPASIRWLLQRCLVKDSRERLRDIGDAQIEIQAALAKSPAIFTSPADRSVYRERLSWSIAAVLFLALVGVAIMLNVARKVPNPTVTRTTILLPADLELDLDFRAYPLALSPDGARLAYVLDDGGRKQLYVRKLSDLEATPIPGTLGAMQPFFSPDGEWVAFFARGLLQKVAVRGGAPLSICKVSGIAMGGSWGLDDTIVFATLDAGLFKVAAVGGTPQRLSGSDRSSWPEILPDGKTVLFTLAESAIATMSLDGSNKRVLARSDASGDGPAAAILGVGTIGPVRFVPTGHLIFGHGAFRMRAVPIDLKTLTLKGSPVSIVDSVFRSADGGPLYFAISRTGTMVYLPEDPRRRLVWVQQDGRVTPIGTDQAAFRYPSVSHDGRHIAVDINTDERRSDIWIYDAERGTKSRLTTDVSSILPVWDLDDTRITFAANDLVSRLSDGSGKKEILLKKEQSFLYPTSWSPHGVDLLFTEDNLRTGMDLWVLPRKDGAPRKLLERQFHDAWAQFSRDGRWVAYVSDESGVNEVYLAHYPEMTGRVIVSTHGGNWPVWSPDGRELFYRQGNAVMAVQVQTTPTLVVGIPKRLFTGPYAGVDGDRKFDVAPDGRRFLMIERIDDARHFIIVQNWFEELKSIAPTN
jgi:serine/threonine protein kinase/Tol biopolymer transport system component